MAIAPTGDIFKGFEFDGESSKDYGVYITGEAVYNAPIRDVEMISIPGRSGQFALDKGRFENIEVTYPAGIFADDEANFAEAISDFRNYMCSRKGYVRLSDDYNPNEYRMAYYKSGLDVSPAQLKAGKFNITFDCKPQRWLTSGETKITVADGDTLTNPTRFDSSPLLEVKGYGAIGFNGYGIELHNAAAGNITLLDGGTELEFTTADTSSLSWNKAVLTDIDSKANEGDLITCGDVTFSILVAYGGNGIDTATLPADVTAVLETQPAPAGSAQRVVGYRVGFTASQTETVEVGQYGQFFSETRAINFVSKGGTAIGTTTLVFTGGISESNGMLTLEYGVSCTTTSGNPLVPYDAYGKNLFTPYEVVVESTKSYLGDPTYIDCDMGECYRIDGGEVMTLNQYIDLGSDLPKLASGNNTISFDNTITELKLTPRWWKV